tara:strand:+ start:1541 stop:2452 length:912 start_codon:yes stop_codon:yes gene_type:complete
MKIVIMGAGAVGSYYGGVLKRNGIDVTLINRGKHHDAIVDKGLNIRSFWGDYNVDINASNETSNLGVFDLVFLTTKLYSNQDAISKLSNLCSDKTLIITIQNGVSSYDELSNFFDSENIIPAATYIEAEIVSPGTILQKGSSVVIEMGEINGNFSERLKNIKNKLSFEELEINISKDIKASLWKKMISVGAFGTIMTSFRSTFGEITSSMYGEEVLRGTMNEILEIGKLEGVNLEDVDIDKVLDGLKEESDTITSSMQQDLIKSKPLEIDNILGHVVVLSKKYNYPAPFSTTLVSSLQKFKEG